MAAHFGVSISKIGEWRNAHYILSQRKRRAEAFQKLYDRGYTDREIATECGCGLTSVWDWRHKHGLKSVTQIQQRAAKVMASQQIMNQAVLDQLVPKR